MFFDRKTEYIKILISPKLIERFNGIIVKIPKEIEKLILKFIGKYKQHEDKRFNLPRKYTSF